MVKSRELIKATFPCDTQVTFLAINKIDGDHYDDLLEVVVDCRDCDEDDGALVGGSDDVISKMRFYKSEIRQLIRLLQAVAEEDS